MFRFSCSYKLTISLVLAWILPCFSFWGQDFPALQDLAQWGGQPNAIKQVAQELKDVQGRVISKEQRAHVFEIFAFDTPGGPQHLLQIQEDQLGELFLLSGVLERGTGEKDLFSSHMLNAVEGYAWYFQKSDDDRKIYFVRKNTDYTVDPDSPMQRTVERSFSDSVMAALDNACLASISEISTESSEGREEFSQGDSPRPKNANADPKPPPQGPQGASAASNRQMHPTLEDIKKTACEGPEQPKSKILAVVLEKIPFDHLFNLKELVEDYPNAKASQTVIEKIKAYPRNVEIETRMDFSADLPRGMLGPSPSTLSDPRGFSLLLHYSLSRLPDSAGYRPRLADERVGYFEKAHYDWSKNAENRPSLNVHWINRWNLQKINPQARFSEVKNPIVFYLENTIPYEYLQAVRAGILAWNEAFARIGFLNALVVKEQDRLSPEERAEFDPADVRFNTVRWFLGKPGDLKYTAIGPFQYNPLNGQIYHAMISVSAWIARAATDKADLISARKSHGGPLNSFFCNYGEHSMAETAFAIAALEAAGRMTAEDKQRLLSDLITHVMIHEVGHTLGLRHNHKANAAYSWERIYDPENQGNYSASNMSYSPVHIPFPNSPQPFYQTHLGPADYWTIQYGYESFDGASTEEERKRLNGIAALSGTNPELAYGEDIEKLLGIDPQVTTMVESRDLIQFGQERVNLVEQLWKNLETQTPTSEEGYQKLRRVFLQSLTVEYSNAVEPVLKLIGGIYASRSRPGDGGKPPFRPVPATMQVQALDFLDRNVFSDRAFPISSHLLQNLATDRLGDLYGHATSLMAFPVSVEDMILDVQKKALDHIYDSTDNLIFGPSVLKRLVQSRRLSSDPKQVMTISKLFDRVRKSIWSEIESPRQGGAISVISPMRRRLQAKHIEHLGNCLKSEDPVVQDAVISARRDLVIISSDINAALGDAMWASSTKGYLRLMDAQIKRLLKGSR